LVKKKTTLSKSACSLSRRENSVILEGELHGKRIIIILKIWMKTVHFLVIREITKMLCMHIDVLHV